MFGCGGFNGVFVPKTLNVRVEELEARLSALETRVLDLEQHSKTYVVFNEDDEELNEKMRSFYVVASSLGVVGKWLVYILASMAGGLAAYNTIVKAVREWLYGT